MKTKKRFIKEIIPNKANFDYCAKAGVINGSLFTDIERIMQKYADQQLAIDSVSQQREQFLVFAEFKDQWEHDNNNMDSNEVIVNEFLKTNNCG